MTKWFVNPKGTSLIKFNNQVTYLIIDNHPRVDIMNELHIKPICENEIAPKEGQRGLLCSNKKSHRCPSLCYQQILNEDNVQQAFNILFKAIKRLENDGS